MTESWLELALIVMILGGIAYAIFRGGAANPEGTGSLARKMNALSMDVATVDGKVAAVDGKVERVKEEVKAIDARVGEIDRRAASIDDVHRLERILGDHQEIMEKVEMRLGELGVSLASRAASADHIARQVDRLYDHIVHKGMNA